MDSSQASEELICLVRTALDARTAGARARAACWLERLDEERLELESLLATRVREEAQAALKGPRVGADWRCETPHLQGVGFWEQLEQALAYLQAREAEVSGIEKEAREVGALVALLRAEALREPAPDSPVPAGVVDGRRSPRVPVRAEIEFVVEDGAGARGLVANVSEGGLFLGCARVPPAGSRIDLAFALPETGWLEASAVVRWARGFDPARPRIVPGAGVEFLDLDERSLEALRQFLEERRAGPAAR